jgi:hypothetical protein
MINPNIIYNEREHTYEIKGRALQSVTNFIEKEYSVPFDHNDKHIYMSNAITKKNKEKKAGITNPEVQRYFWKLNGKHAALVGNAVHTYMQLLNIGIKYNFEVEPRMSYDVGVKDVISKLMNKWDIVEVEKQVFSEKYDLVGTLDLLIRNKETNELGIIDWKVKPDILKSHNKCKGTLSKFNETGLLMASVQMQLYNIVGELNIPIDNMFVIQLFKDSSYKIYGGKKEPLVDYSQYILETLNTRVIPKDKKINNLMSLI